MTMKIVEPLTLEKKRDLNDQELMAVRAWYQAAEARPEHPELENLSRILWEEKKWLACDCQVDMQEPPLLYPRRTPNGRYTLVRMHGRTQHAKECFMVYESKHGTSNTTKHSTLTKQMRLYCEWLYKAEIHIKHAGDVDHPLTEEYRTLKRVAKNIEIAPEQTLADHLETDASRYTPFCLQAKARFKEWPGNLEPSGYLFTTAQSIQGGKITFYGKSHAIQHQARMETRGTPPHVVLIEVGPKMSRGGYIEPRFILAISQLDRTTLLPAMHESCRDTYKELRKIQTWLQNKHQMETLLTVVLPTMALADSDIDFTLSSISHPEHTVNIISIEAGERIADHEVPDEADWQSVYHLTGRGDELDRRFWKIVLAKMLSSTQHETIHNEEIVHE